MNKFRMPPDVGQRHNLWCVMPKPLPNKDKPNWLSPLLISSTINVHCSEPFTASGARYPCPLGLLVSQRYNDQLSMGFGSHLNGILPGLQLENRRFRWGDCYRLDCLLYQRSGRILLREGKGENLLKIQNFPLGPRRKLEAGGLLQFYKVGRSGTKSAWGFDVRISILSNTPNRVHCFDGLTTSVWFCDTCFFAPPELVSEGSLWTIPSGYNSRHFLL